MYVINTTYHVAKKKVRSCGLANDVCELDNEQLQRLSESEFEYIQNYKKNGCRIRIGTKYMVQAQNDCGSLVFFYCDLQVWDILRKNSLLYDWNDELIKPLHENNS